MTERTAILGRDFRVYIEGVELGPISGDLDPGSRASGWVEWHGRDPWADFASIAIKGRYYGPVIDISAFDLAGRPRTHPRSPRESLRRRR